MTKEESKQKITELVKKYKTLLTSEIKSFNEANTKQGFILPLFAALGWDVNETKEVTMEEAASGGRVDFAFKLNGVAYFYLEAKKLNADLNNPEHMKQAVTYAYGNGVTWAVLTNFDELLLLNAQKTTPFITLKYDDYIKDFDKLWLLSRESLSNGHLNKEATQFGALTKLIPIEERLFRQLRVWREELFNQLFHFNQWLEPEPRDEIIEKLFNRLIFIRTCEDRKLEEHQLLSALRQWQKGGKKKAELLAALRKIFDYYRGYYDSDLFASHLLDDSRVFIFDDTIANILIGLYDVPGGMASYDFAIIDADVLGRVYEQYLGYIANAVVAKAKEAQTKMALGFAIDTNYELMEKKQHRKEQGIYYTPKFVTDYIVKETVRRFIQENEHDGNNKILNMKILDLACGSGSFLIRAYDELLNYHATISSKRTSELGQNDRLPILTRNIFGVDLDERAVEIARLNLLLRSLANRDLLPPLTDNIKQGNSLISGTDEELNRYFGSDLKNKNNFIWEDEFSDIIASGGFDVIIGNPPYVRIQSLPKDEANYYRSHYDSAFGSFDIYVLFIEKAIRLLKPGGKLGFITSGKFLKSEYGKKIQQVLNERCTIEAIIDLSTQQVFAEATTYPIIVVMHKGAEKKCFDYFFIPDNGPRPIDISVLPPVLAGQDAIIKGIWPLSTNNTNLMRTLSKNAIPLNKITERIFQGIKTSADDIYTLKLLTESDNYVTAFSKSLQARVDLEKPLLRPLIKTGQMKRYHVEKPELVILFPYINGDLLSSAELGSNYPKVWRYLNDNIDALKKREHGLFQNEERWYQYGRNQALKVINFPKIITPDFAPSARYSLDTTGEYFFSGGTAGGYGLIPAKGINSLFLLGLLNSKLLDWFLQKTSANFQGGWFSYESRFISHIPIHQIDNSSPIEMKMHDKLVTLVESMLELNTHLASIQDIYINKRDELVKEIQKTDKDINILVYDLYGLTEAEKALIESSTI
jgi:type I restriction-modification system DNA methylase subunit